jgi:hypothetical protein
MGDLAKNGVGSPFLGVVGRDLGQVWLEMGQILRPGLRPGELSRVGQKTTSQALPADKIEDFFLKVRFDKSLHRV